MNNNPARLSVGALSTNCWVYAVEGDTTIIDPGGDADKIITHLNAKKLRPNRILLTHGHFDHIEALPRIHDAFPDAPISIHSDDLDFVNEKGLETQCFDFRTASGDDSFIRGLWRDMPPISRPIADGDNIGPFRVIHTPGHTRGSVVFYHAEAGILFSGDTLFCNAIGRTDLLGGDMSQMTASLHRLFSLDGATQVFPGHGRVTTIAAEKSR
jgi:glyoxylase-like metal-dependent hydrolase (beta-lactamase superfamily II)